MAMLGSGASLANPVMAAVPMAGYIAKTLADRGARRGTARLGARVQADGEPPVSPLVLSAREAVESLAISIFDQSRRTASP